MRHPLEKLPSIRHQIFSLLISYLVIFVFAHIEYRSKSMPQTIHILPNIEQSIGILESTISILHSIFKLSFILSQFIYQNSNPFKLLIFIEGSFILAFQLIVIVLIPDQFALLLFPPFKLSIKLVTISHLHDSLPMKKVIFEVASVNKFIFDILPFSISLAIFHISMIIRSISHEIKPLRLSFPIFELANKSGSIFKYNLPISMRVS